MSNPVYSQQSQATPLSKYMGVLLIMVLVFALGWSVGSTQAKNRLATTGSMVSDAHGDPERVDMGLFWETWSVLEQKYVDPQELMTNEMVYGAIEGMVAATGDPYTVFMTPKESREFQEQVDGEFEGIGVEITLKNNVLTVVSPLKNSPAKLAGLQPEDIITHIDGELSDGFTLEEAARLIRGPKETTVDLTVLRERTGEIFELTIERQDITIDSVEWVLEGGNIALIQVNRFSGETTNDFAKVASEVLNAQVDGIVLDLRFNSGGLLESSTDISSTFLEGKNKKLVTIKRRNSEDDEVIYSNGKGRLVNIPMVVIINSGTASAAEIVAGALQDHNRAKVVGEQSFGKGTVQSVENLSGGASLRVTIAKWFTPNDHNISESGITPDIEVPMSLEDYANGVDPQLDKALELLREEI